MKNSTKKFDTLNIEPMNNAHLIKGGRKLRPDGTSPSSSTSGNP